MKQAGLIENSGKKVIVIYQNILSIYMWCKSYDTVHKIIWIMNKL